MSAQPVLAPSPRPTREERRRSLRLVPPPKPRLSRASFLMLLIGLVGIGMVGLLLLNTALQNQAFAASQLRQQAAQSSYKQGELTQLVIEAGSTRELTRKATELGMRPNQGIGFVELPDGRISGDPTEADGDFLLSALSKSAEQVAQERSEQALKRAHERRMEEQRVLLAHRQRLIDARTPREAAAGRPPAAENSTGENSRTENSTSRDSTAQDPAGRALARQPGDQAAGQPETTDAAGDR